MRPFTPATTAALVAGLFGGVTVDAPLALGVTVSLCAAWVIGVIARRRGSDRLQLFAGAVAVAAVAWVFGAHSVDAALHSPLRTLLEQRLGGFAIDGIERRGDEPVTIEGRLTSDAALIDGGTVVRLDVLRVSIYGVDEIATGGVSLGISGQPNPDTIREWRAGRIIRAPALLRRPARYLNEGLADQERALARRGVSLVGTIKSAALVELVAHGRWWEEFAAHVRARSREAIGRHVRILGEQSAAIGTAILVGDRAGLSVETEQLLQEAGTYHVIAISGGNIAILAGLLLGVLAAAGVHGRAAALLAIVAITAYGVVAAGGPSVARATLMAVVYLAVRLIDQRTPAANAIALSAAAILLANPLQVIDVGFWFTFAATMALVSSAAFVRMATNERAGYANKGARVTRVATSIGLVLLATACVELVLAPIAALVFQRVTLAGLMLNFAALPAMTMVQIAAMAVVAADLAGAQTIASVIGHGVHLGAWVLVDSARLLEHAPWLTWRVPPPHAGIIAAYYVALFAAVMAWKRARWRHVRTATVITASALFLWIIVGPGARARERGDGTLRVTMMDVGQGDSIHVTFPNGRTLLVDTGGVARGTFDIGERVVAPTLRAAGHLSLDYLAITHADTDHVGGARTLIRDFEPHEVWWSIPIANHEQTERVKAEATRQRAAWRTLQRGDRVTIGGVEVRAHHPPPPEWEQQRIRNNDSLVLELRYGTVSMLLTGDISREIEEELAATLNPLPVVILKVAHHGSGTSTTERFLRLAPPAVALIGVGRGNPYGHPAPYVMGRLHDAGAEVFRTDLDGQVIVSTDGQAVWSRTFTGRRHKLSHPARGAPTATSR
jgi:competence protein ComEC